MNIGTRYYCLGNNQIDKIERIDFFLPKVDKNGPIPSYAPHLGKCWQWSGAKHKNGYGTFWDGESAVRPHRWFYKYLNGNISDDLVIDHLCRNPSCVNPKHLEAVTQQQNVDRSPIHNANKLKCPSGHEYNIGHRIKYGKCKICAAEAGAKYYRKRKANDPDYKN